MEALAILENKIEELVKLISELKQKNASLKEENAFFAEETVELKRRVDGLEKLTTDAQKESEEERELTRVLVDSLIKDIDAVVEQEH